jgi:metallophosphoesterase (TIGR03768 family)
MKLSIRLAIVKITSLSIPLLLPLSGNAAELGTRQRTITPVALQTNSTPAILASNLPAYAVYGYSDWEWGSGQDAGQLFTNMMPVGYLGTTNAARVLSFFCFSDIHIVDKESPSQADWAAYQTETGFTNNTPPPGSGNSSAYSPVILRTTQVLDAAVKTVNALHQMMSFDFGMSLGDDCNGSQYNELRWFIDVMDGLPITPSSGTNAGATTIDYQKPFHAAGLEASIPWYAVLGNHDHFWLGSWPVTEYLRQSFTNNTVLLMGDLKTQGVTSRSDFTGTVDGSTPYGTIIGAGSVSNYVVGGVTNAPTVAPDPNRYSLTRNNWMREFFTTTSQPVGHGFSQANIAADFAYYSFVPKATLPLKVIVLDDTMTDENFDFNGQGGLDTNQLAWLVRELDQGQAHDQLMIIAAHIPIELVGMSGSTNSIISGTNLVYLLNTYPNLLLWVTGHMHRNNIKAHPSPYTDRPEYGFWEVENPSLRDFPQEFRTFEILRNTDNSISMMVTDIDPYAPTNSQADISRGFAVGASRISAMPSTSLTDTDSYTQNAELVKMLTPPMQIKIAKLGEPLGHRVAMDHTDDGVAINFLGELQSAQTLTGPWVNVTDTSPYAIPATASAKFYRPVE